MRILDKNTDFYDYLQNIYRDTPVTFDRTDSFVLTKELVCYYLQWGRWYRKRREPIRWMLLQVCNTFWLFVLEITEFSGYDDPKSYKVNLVAKWKNYNKTRCLINLSTIEFKWSTTYWISDIHILLNLLDSLKGDRIPNDVSRLISAVDMNEYETFYTFDKYTIRHDDGNHAEKHIPLLKASGLSNFIDPLDIFLAFEEYFSLEKQSKERSESLGLTDVEKVENHGFDKKTSFRGK